MDVRVFTLEELESHIQDIHSNTKQVSPLSPLRLQSYLKNPRARQSDPVLFELRQKDQLVAYRSLLPDHFYDLEANPQRFAWLSGNWVDPAFRRKGYSTRLLREVEARWEGNLMYTNYAPASKAVYDQTGQFPVLLERKGKRFYLRAAAEELLGDRLGSRALLRFGDQTLNLLRERKLGKYASEDAEDCRIEKVERLSGEQKDLVDSMLKSSLFGRDSELLNWILDYPWVTEGPVENPNYHFSYRSDRFENILLAFTLADQSRGLLWMVLHKRALTVPYLFAESDLLLPLMARMVIRTMISQKCAYTTIRHAALASQLELHKDLFLSIRNMPQLIFAHKKIEKQVLRDREIQDGDGDVVFTG